MDDKTAKELLKKYRNQTLSETERQALLRLTETGNDAALIQALERMLTEDQAPKVPVDQKRLDRSLKKVLEADKPHRRTSAHRMRWVGYAAAAILVAGIGFFAWFNLDRSAAREDQNTTYIAAEDIAPGGQRAMLTLADGSSIQLDNREDGALPMQAGSQVLKKDGALIYTLQNPGTEGMAYNTLRTPKGGIYQLRLPDGTRVLLNAASSIRYPVAFSGKERLVEVSGEVYFEVVSMPEKPFKVQIDAQNSIEVLGTHFNVKAYPEEQQITTTLLEGKVEQHSAGKKVYLLPGQQAQASKSGLSVSTIGAAGVASVMAWKDGRFNFQDADLQEIMRQLSRWYDIEVVYEDGIPERQFIGEIQRTLPLSEVLKGLEMSGVRFRLEEGRRLVVLP